jgi:hypothetical protein
MNQPPPPGWAIVQFDSLRQIEQNIGTPDEHMLAVLNFTFIKDGHAQPGMQLVIKQLVGSKVGEDAVVELVGAPSHQIPVSNTILREIAEAYYNKFLAMFGGGGHMYMANNEFQMLNQFDVQCTEGKDISW